MIFQYVHIIRNLLLRIRFILLKSGFFGVFSLRFGA